MNSSQFSSEYGGFMNHAAPHQRGYGETMGTMDASSMGMRHRDRDTMETQLDMRTVSQKSSHTTSVPAECSADGEIRNHMCSMLTELRSNTRVLVHLMRQHDFIAMLSEQQFESYQNAIERLGVTSMQMEEVIEASKYLDSRRELCS